MSEDEPEPEPGFEARLRRLAQQLNESIERLDDLDLDEMARSAGIDPDKLRRYLEGADEWLTERVNQFAGEGASRLNSILDAIRTDFASGGGSSSGGAPHPLDTPTPAQGLALSALDSGRWSVRPGSHVIDTTDEGPAPEEASGIVGELRARDWIGPDGGLTITGQNALRRWVESGSNG